MLIRAPVLAFDAAYVVIGSFWGDRRRKGGQFFVLNKIYNLKAESLDKHSYIVYYNHARWIVGGKNVPG